MGLGPAASRWMSWTAAIRLTLAVSRSTSETVGSPSSAFLPTYPGIPHRVTFSPDGISATWGVPDGTVAVCELLELNRRLGEVGMGW